jgi:putative chitinase
MLRRNPGPYTDEVKAGISKEVTRESSTHDMFEALCEAGANRDVDALCRVGQIYGSTPAGEDWLALGKMHNTQVAAEELAAQQAQTHAQQQRGPVMSR